MTAILCGIVWALGVGWLLYQFKHPLEVDENGNEIETKER